MPVRNTKGFAAYALLGAMAALGAGMQLACHKHSKQDDFTQPPVLSYQTTLILPTAGQPFTSVAPDVSAYYYLDGVGSFVTTGFRFSVVPALPAGLALDPATGIISGSPAGVSAQASYAITASDYVNNGGGATSFTVTLGVQASSPVTLDYAGAGAASAALGGLMHLAPPTASGGVPTGFGVSPALPAGLALDPNSGLVSGRPTAVTSGTTFTLSATTPSGSANARFTLVVTETQPTAPLMGLGYGAGPFITPHGQPFTLPAPNFSTTPVGVVFTISPALPAGLALDPLTGAIAGTPLAAAAQTTYTVTASNGGGFCQFDVNLTIS